MKSLENFFLKPASPQPLAGLRIGLSILLIAQAYMLRGTVLDFFAQDGIIQDGLAQYLAVPYTPRISLLVHWLSPWVGENQIIWTTCGLYFLSLLMLGVGLFTPLSAVIAWFLHWTLMNTGYTTAYGVDLYAHVFLFYLMWSPSGRAWSVDVALGRVKSTPSSWARLMIRTIQLHLCLSYLSSGLEKAAGPQWWNGELLWRALYLPVYHQFNMYWLASWPWLSKIGGWTTLIFELGYCIFIWPKLTRKLWVLGITALHLGIAVFLGLGLFGAVMCILTLAMFGVSSEPGAVLTENEKLARFQGWDLALHRY